MYFLLFSVCYSSLAQFFLNSKCVLFLNCCKTCSIVLGIVTFPQYVQFIVDAWSSRELLDIHWHPQYQMCHPCHVKYDFIGRFENMQEDAKHVIDKLSRRHGLNVTFPLLNAFKGNIRQFYAGISRDTMRKLIRIYKLDYELFGYDYRWACDDC